MASVPRIRNQSNLEDSKDFRNLERTELLLEPEPYTDTGADAGADISSTTRCHSGSGNRNATVTQISSMPLPLQLHYTTRYYCRCHPAITLLSTTACQMRGFFLDKRLASNGTGASPPPPLSRKSEGQSSPVQSRPVRSSPFGSHHCSTSQRSGSIPSKRAQSPHSLKSKLGLNAQIGKKGTRAGHLFNGRSIHYTNDEVLDYIDPS